MLVRGGKFIIRLAGSQHVTMCGMEMFHYKNGTMHPVQEQVDTPGINRPFQNRFGKTLEIIFAWGHVEFFQPITQEQLTSEFYKQILQFSIFQVQ